MEALDAVLLDMDGTILDTTVELCTAVAQAVNRIVPHLNLHHSHILSNYPNLYGGPLEEFHDTIILPHLGSPSEEQKAASTSQFIKFFLEEVKKAPPSPAFEDVLVALQSLRAKYPSLLFAVATTKPTPTAENDLTSTAVPAALRPLLSHVQGTDTGILPKPAPDVLLRCSDALGVDVKKTIYVGDTSRDSGAGRAAGCLLTLTVQRDAEKIGDTLGANAAIRDFHEIERAVNEML
mmetsp:Transcript_16255/g.33432  ORF Transcript_16255/g.33432 Transcript_16255/m.33432 type:complete len:236 (-) Transcript_16255:28-735(-)